MQPVCRAYVDRGTGPECGISGYGDVDDGGSLIMKGNDR